MNGLLILPHLGLGDAIICNAIFRHCAKTEEFICIPVKYHNVTSVQFMLRDLRNVVIRPVEDDADALFFYQQVWKGARMGLGCYSGLKLNAHEWDQEFFRHAGVPFEARWSQWNCVRDKGIENQLFWPRFGSNWPIKDMVFVHDDASRGMNIPLSKIESGPMGSEYDRVIRPNPQRTDLPIFAYWQWITNASEIHCICSSFSLFIDSIELPLKPKLFLHSYCRPGEPLPAYKKEWTIL